MDNETKRARITRYVMATVAIVFGLMTLKSGGQVLFGGEEARRAAGDYVGFVLWFNFIAGFAYIGAGAGFAIKWATSRWLAALIAAASAAVFAAFGLHIWQGGAFETRTVAAMTLRTGLWLVLAITAFGFFASSHHPPSHGVSR